MKKIRFIEFYKVVFCGFFIFFVSPLTFFPYYNPIYAGKPGSSGYYINSTSVWYEYCDGWDLFCIYKDYDKYFIDGDTTIDGMNYFILHLVRIDSVIPDDTAFCTDTSVNIIDYGIRGFLRDDSTKKFYYRAKNDSVEKVILDFNLKDGDTLSINCPDPIIVDSVSVTIFDSSIRKIFHLVSGPFSGMFLIEGVGSSSGGLFGVGCPGTIVIEGGCSFLCFSQNGDNLPCNSPYSCDFLSSIGEKGFVTVKKTEFILFPNPVSGTTTVVLNSLTAGVDFSLIVTDIAGREIKSYIFKQKSITISANELDDGIYFLALYNNLQFIAAEKLIVAK